MRNDIQLTDKQRERAIAYFDYVRQEVRKLPFLWRFLVCHVFNRRDYKIAKSYAEAGSWEWPSDYTTISNQYQAEVFARMFMLEPFKNEP